MKKNVALILLGISTFTLGFAYLNLQSSLGIKDARSSLGQLFSSSDNRNQLDKKNIKIINLQKDINKLAKNFEGELGIYLKSMTDDISYGFNALTPWYLSTLTNTMLLFFIFDSLEEGNLSLAQRPLIAENVSEHVYSNIKNKDHVININDLIKNSVIQSNLIASDILHDVLGESKISDFISKIVPKQIGTILTNEQTQKMIFSNIHPKIKMNAIHSREIYQKKSIKDKINYLTKQFGIPRGQLLENKITNSYNHFYELMYNSGTLVGVGKILEDFLNNNIMAQKLKEILIDTLRESNLKMKSQKNGLISSNNYVFQKSYEHNNVCELGWTTQAKEDHGVLLIVCAKNFDKLQNVTRLFGRIGSSIKKNIM